MDAAATDTTTAKDSILISLQRQLQMHSLRHICLVRNWPLLLGGKGGSSFLPVIRQELLPSLARYSQY